MSTSPTATASQAPSPPTVAKPQPEYVLGTGHDELSRLGLQHRLWADAAHALWKAARIAPGSRVLDVGSGPGYAALDLGELVTGSGSVVGIDESAGFIEHLNTQARARGMAHVRGLVGDVQQIATALDASSAARPDGRHNGQFDAAYARWVLCFVPDPERVIAQVSAQLKPGGRFCVHDYFNYTSMTMAPRRASHDTAVAATAASWRERGGDPDIAGRLPQLMARHGLTLTHLSVHQRIARGTESMFAWPEVWWQTYAPKLVAMGRITQADCDQLLRDIADAKASPTSFIVTPPVYELIGTKQG